MLAILSLELTVATRRSALAGAVVAHVVVLTALGMVWTGAGRDGIPASALHGVLRTVQDAWLSVLLPWMVVRLLTNGQDDVVRLSCLTATRPAAIVGARLLAAVLLAALVTVAALPVSILVQRMSMEAPATVAADHIVLAVRAAAAAAIAFAWMTWCRNRIAAWIGSSVSLGALGAVVSALAPGPSGTAVLATVALGVAATVVAYTETAWRYLSEDLA